LIGKAMNDEQESTIVSTADVPQRTSSGLRALRTAIGTLLLGVIAGNAIVYAAPEWTSSLANSLPKSWSQGCCGSQRDCGTGGCPLGACPLDGDSAGLTEIGLPASVLDRSFEEQMREKAAEAREQAEN
jgi:hypothetical protein